MGRLPVVMVVVAEAEIDPAHNRLIPMRSVEGRRRRVIRPTNRARPAPAPPIALSRGRCRRPHPEKAPAAYGSSHHRTLSAPPTAADMAARRQRASARFSSFAWSSWPFRAPLSGEFGTIIPGARAHGPGLAGLHPRPGRRLLPSVQIVEIGRASCRERVEIL